MTTEKKISDLNAANSPTGSDLIEIVQNISGVLTSRKIAITNFMSLFVGPTGPAGPVAYKSIVFYVDGSGSLIAPGTYALGKAGFAGTVVGYDIVTDLSTSATFDVWRTANTGGLPSSSSNSIIGSTLLALSSALEGTGTPSGWTSIAIAEADNLLLNVATNSAAKRIQVTLKVQASA